MGTFIPADSSQPTREIVPQNGRDFDLPQLYELPTCDTIETLSLADDSIMILDEEGKIAQKPRNGRATRLAGFVQPGQLVAELLRLRHAGIGVIRVGEPLTDLMTETDYIAGDVLICTGHELS